MYCPKCGNFNDEGATFCKYCGASLSSDNTISFEKLNRDNTPVKRLLSEARTTYVLGILSIVFCTLGGLIGIILAAFNLSKINALNNMNFFPNDNRELDDYERGKKKLYLSRKLSIIGLIIFAVSSVLQLILVYVLAELGINLGPMIIY